MKCSPNCQRTWGNPAPSASYLKINIPFPPAPFFTKGARQPRKNDKTFAHMISISSASVYKINTLNLEPFFARLLKACIRYFLSNFYFSSNDSPSKTMNNIFLFHLKSSFRSIDIQSFVFRSSPLFFRVSHCFRG